MWPGAPGPVALFARNSVPEVTRSGPRPQSWNEFLTSHGNSTFLEGNTAYADPDFFTVFDFRLLKGNRTHPFTDDHSIVITESMAKRYFGDADPMGKTLVLDKKDNFTVTGVLADFPANSSLNYDILFPMDLYAHNFDGNGKGKSIDEDLGNFVFN